MSSLSTHDTIKRIGIAEMQLSESPDVILSAPHLGSCLGVAVYHPKTKFGAMVHCLLPFSKKDPEKAKNKPFMYVDTGIAKMLEETAKRGIPLKELYIYAAGAANINDEKNIFEIGKKNHTVFKKLLWKNKLLVKGEHVGGTSAKTISLRLSDGLVTVMSEGSIITL